MTIILLQFTNKILYFTDRELKEITTSRRDEHNPNVVQCPIRMDNPAPLQLVRMVSIFDKFQSWKMNTRNKGLLLSLIGVIILSPDSLLIRLVDLDDFSLIFYRSALPIFTVFLFLLYHYKSSVFKSFISIGLVGIVYAILYAITHICFVYSIQYTAVSNTLTIIASAPILSLIHI